MTQEIGDKEMASNYYQLAAEGGIQDNKMKTAAEWSLKAAELQDWGVLKCGHMFKRLLKG